MPRNRTERELTKRNFYEIANFPGVLGCVDGTHIPIIAPPENEYMYVNRKNFHSINVQVICDTGMLFEDVYAKWPGANHDSFILTQSTVHDNFEQGHYGEGWIIGDSGYGQKSWLMTPLATPVTNQQKKYNRSLVKTRCLIERAIGEAKSRWRIIDHTGGRLCYLPQKVSKITVTCCVLHNMCKRANIPMLEEPISLESIRRMRIEELEPPQASLNGVQQRQRVISMF